jgi:hypothetical protein
MLDPVAIAWAHCNPRVPPPASLRCWEPPQIDVQRAEEARQRKIEGNRKRRRASAETRVSSAHPRLEAC